MSPSRAGRCTLVTGAGQGIGRACVELLLADGGSVVAVDLALRMLRASPVEAAPLLQGDASTLPFADSVFHGVAMFNMLLFPEEVDRVESPDGGQLLWINSSGDRTPIHLSPEDFLAALPGASSGAWSARWARSGTGFWVVASRGLPAA